MICQICKNEFTDSGFTYHIKFSHKMTAKTYYDKYIRKENEGLCKICGQESNFLSISKGYTNTCPNCNVQSQKMICRICGQETKALGMPSHLKSKHKITTKDYYDQFLIEGRCRVCGKPTKFGTITTGYNKTCSRACQYIWQQSEEYESIRKQTILDKYGVEYTGQIESAKEKRKQTTQEHYGVDNPFQAEEIKEKSKQTNMERYGVPIAYAYGTEQFRDNMKKKLSLDAQEQVDKMLEKSKQTRDENFSLDNSLTDEDL